MVSKVVMYFHLFGVELFVLLEDEDPPKVAGHTLLSSLSNQDIEEGI